MSAVKLIPNLLAWAGIVLVLLRGFNGRRSIVVTAASVGFTFGVAGVFVLFRTSPDSPFVLIKSALGVGFFLFWFLAVAVIYRSTVQANTISREMRFMEKPLIACIGAALTGIVAGAVAACKMPGIESFTTQIIAFAALALAGAAIAISIMPVEKRLPSLITVTPATMFAAVMSLLLFCSSHILRLDLFSPLSMKVMKGTHDFVHQFMESVLVPDHIFIRPEIWKYIGILFGKEVGFWGGIVIWFSPVLFILLAMNLERLPSVAHIRQGAQRRKMLADAIRARRFRQVIPVSALIIFAAAAYKSSFPNVEYWDPKPLPITATPAGEIFIPKKGDVDLGDGKLHKYLYKQGGKEVRFFVLKTPDGKFTVDLDACAICKPDGYGQAEGAVICYYCVTLIPLDTVGKPGGCNPVPIPFTDREDGVLIDGVTLVRSWSQTVQATTRIKESGK